MRIAITGLAHMREYADLQLRTEPKNLGLRPNLRISDMRTLKKKTGSLTILRTVLVAL
jgi:hypothetical protein